ncbi:SDR family NAD(P)-dependent oxidoreductase [Advenella mimigardefordensis]|uniref:Putative oxidoreductase, SDR family n=1 Tax=Advenella mimigardefordensis (strain DSM 17166 / LMG 22922 / DPN7) TaxID=1247726 RepID=W0PIM9_ADVMD|nr:SDR family NAD(P)-dependent oxidoreductase [Advenella mimigardefordensis]AHG65335.1 putative oxidoreductase, SDR family [Advenella mimigardefordensis DPN7]
MTVPLRKPARKNPVERTRQPTLPAAARSRTFHGMTRAAAEGRFELQVCQECSKIQYPPRDVCGYCLSHRLQWSEVDRRATLVATTVLHHSNDVYFRERLPWRIGTVHMTAGPVVIAHVHPACEEGTPVQLEMKLDRSGNAALFALPPVLPPHYLDDPMMREMTNDVKFRRVLVTDGKSALGMAMIGALLQTDASIIFVGDQQPWRPCAAFNSLLADSRIQVHAMDVTDSDSLERVAAEIGGKVDVLINTADLLRDGGMLGTNNVSTASDMFNVSCLGLLRLAQTFGGAMAGRAADGANSASAWVNIFSIHALASLPSRGVWSAAQAGGLSLSHCLRAELQTVGIRVMNVFTGPVDYEWEQTTPPPRVAPAQIARQIVQGLANGLEDVYVGDVANDIRERLRSNAKALERELASGN